MSKEIEQISLDDLDLPGLGGEQKETVLELIKGISSDVLLVSARKFEIGIAMDRLYGITGHGSFEPLRKRFFPEVSKRSAQRYRAVGREFGVYKEYVMDIGFSYLGKLAEKNELAILKSDLIDQANRGEKADGHVYRTKIVELLREEDEVEGIGQEIVEDDKRRSEATERDSSRKNAVRKETIDEKSMDILDRCIPSDPEQLQALWSVLSTPKGKRDATDYLCKRIGDLVHNSNVQRSVDTKRSFEDSPELAYN